MVRRMPTVDDVRTALDAALADAERALRDAAAAGVVPDDLRSRHAELVATLTALRARLEGAIE